MNPDVTFLLENGNPSIKYRTRLEILGEDPKSPEMEELYGQILEDPQVVHCLGLSQPDGALGTLFHTTGDSDPFEGSEINIKFLAEMGVKPDHPLLKAGLDFLLQPGGTRELAPKNDAMSEGGEYICASLFARAGVENRLVRKRCELALDSFATTLRFKSYTQVAVEFRQKLVYRDGVKWPNIYDLQTLAFSKQWRTVENLLLVERALDHLTTFPLFEKIYERSDKTFYSPAEALQDNILPDIGSLPKGESSKWWKRMEYIARCGVSPKVFRAQAGKLESMDNEALSQTFNDGCIRNWSAYHGLRLMESWKNQGRLIDTIFRKSLILGYSKH
jgi:hypothetical protein